MMNSSSPSLLRNLRLSSALASVFACATLAPVQAQILPEVSAGGDGGATIVRNVGAGTMNVDVNGGSRIVTYDTFSLAPTTVLTFTNTGLQQATSVLNRVVAGGPASQIDGTILSASNIAVWLVNGAGITFGPSGKFSGGSLVLSTFDLKGAQPLADAAYLAGITPTTVAGTSTAGILLSANSSIISSGSVIAIGQQLAANGTITASAGDVALIAATDVQLPANLGSPLSFTINAGTTLATAQASVGGAISGASVKLAGASQGGAIVNLLNIDTGGSLTATGVGGKIVISTRAIVGDGITVAATVLGADGITSAGALETKTGATDVTMLGTGDVIQTGTVTALGNYALTSTASNAAQGAGVVVAGGSFTIAAANGLAAVVGGVTVGGNYIGAARGIALGGLVAVEQKAVGTVDMTATAGGITGTANLTVTANTDGINGEALVLDATGGAIDFAAGSTLKGGLNRESMVGIRIGAAPQSLTLGNVAAATLVDVDAAHAAFGAGLALGGNAAPVVLGNVTTAGALLVTANGAITAGTIDVTGASQGVHLESTAAAADLTTGAINAAGGIDLISRRDITTVSATTIDGTIGVSAGRDVAGPAGTGAVFTANGAGRDLTIGALNRVRLGAIRAANTVSVRAGVAATIASGTAIAGDILYDFGPNLTASSIGDQTAGRSIAIRSTGTGGIAAAVGGAGLTAGEDIAIRAGSGGVSLTSLKAGDDIDVVSTGAVSLTSFDASVPGANVDARRIDLTGATIAFVAGEDASHVGANVLLTNAGGVGNLTISTSGAAADDIVLDTTGIAAIGQQTAGRSLAIRASGAITGTTLIAGEDITLRAGAAGVLLTRLQAGDDIDVTSAGIIALDTFDARGVGSGVDLRRVDLSGAGIAFVAGEQADHVGANAWLSNRTGADNLTIGTSGKAAADIVLDTSGRASVMRQDAGGTIALRAATGLIATILTAGEDVAALSGSTLSIDHAVAGDDVMAHSVGRLDLKQANAAGIANVDASRVDFSGAAIVLQAGELAGDAGANLSAISTGGDVFAGAGGNVRARDVASLRSDTGNVRLGTLTATNGSATVMAALDATGLIGASIGTSDLAVGRADVIAGTDVVVVAGGLAQLGAVIGDANVTVTAGNAAPTNGAIDITTAAARTGALTLIARAVAPVGTVYDGDILLGAGTAGGNVMLSNTGTGGTAGNIQIADHVTAGGTATLVSAVDVRIREFLASAPATGFVRSTGGDVTITAVRSVYGITAPIALMVVDRGVSSVQAGGSILLNATGDARIDQLSGASISATIAGSLTGSALGATGTGVTGGAVFANAPGGKVTVNAGATAADVARFNTVIAGGDIELSAGNIAVGTLTSTNGTVTLNGGPAVTGNVYVGALSVPGNVSIALGGAAAAVPFITTTATSDVFDTGFGRTGLSAAGMMTATIGRVAQLGAVQSGTSTAITAAGIGAVTANAGTSLALTTTSGSLALTTGSGTAVSLTKQGGTIVTPGDELRVTDKITSGLGGTTILSNTHVRVKEAISTGSDTSVTATLGDVSGLAIPLATDTRLLPGFDRAKLSATAIDKRVAVNVLAGTAQLGTVLAGTGLTTNTLVPDQIDIRAAAIDVTSATATNGKLRLTSSVGDVRLADGSAGVDAIIGATLSARIGTLTARTGNLGVTAVTGDVTGLPAVRTPVLAGLVTTGSILTTQAGAAKLEATVGAVSVSAFNAAQLDTVLAGTNIGATAKALVANTTTSGFAQSLTATQGTLALGTGSAGTSATLIKQLGNLVTAGDELRVTGSLTAGVVNTRSGAATLVSGTHIRVPAVEARGGNVTLTATDGEVTGTAGGRADLTAAMARDATGGGIAGTDRSIAVTSGLVSRFGTLSAGDAITVLAGSSSGAARDGAIDLIEATTTRGDLTLDVFNDDPALANSIVVTRTVNLAGTRDIGGFASLRTLGTNGGSIIVSDLIKAGGDIVANSVGDTRMLHAISDRTIAVMAGGGVSSSDFTAGEDIGGSAAGGISIGTLVAGDDIDLTGSSIAIASATATGIGPDTSAVDFSLSPIPITVAERADRAKANITLRATAPIGGIVVSGDLSAQRNVAMISASSATIAGNVTAGAPLGGTVIGGDYSVQATNVVFGDAIARTQAASGSVSVVSGGNITQGTGRLTLNVNSDRVGTEGLTLAAGNSVILTNSALIGGSTVGRESSIGITATNGLVALGKVDGQSLNVRANTGITVGEAIDAGNAVRLADPLAGGSTIDLATILGGISLTTGTAFGGSHDIALTAPGPIQAITLVAARDVQAKASTGTVTVTTATAGRDLTVTAGTDVVITTGTATTRDIAIDAGRHSRTGTLVAGAAIGVIARNGEATGLVGASTGTSESTATRAAMAAGSTLAVTAAGLIQLSTAQAGTGLILTAGDATRNGSIDVTSARTIAGSMMLDARAAGSTDSAHDGDILVGDAKAGGNLTMTNVTRGGSDGNVAVTTRADAGGFLLLDGSNDATLPLGTAGGAATIKAIRNATATSLVAGGAATLNAGGVATSGTLIQSILANVQVDGAIVTLNKAEAKTTLVATARNGDLMLNTGIAGTIATLTTQGASAVPGSGDVIVTTGLTSGQDATIQAFGDARLFSIEAATGNVKVTALAGETTGIGTGAATLKATTGAVQVDTGVLARLGTVSASTTVAVTGTGAVQIATGQAGTGLTVAAGTTASNGAIDATILKTITGNLLLDARSTSGVDAARDGHVAVGLTAAGGNLTATNVARGGTVGDVTIGTSADAGGVLLIDSAGNAALPLGIAGGSGTVRAMGSASAGSLTTGGTATLSAGGAASSATLIRSIGANVLASGTTVSLNTADAKTALDVIARIGDLTLVTGLAGTVANLTTSVGATGDVIVTTDLTSGQAATITSISDARLANVKATTGALRVTALAGEVTGIGAGTANLEATTGSVQVDGGTLTRLGTIKAGTTLAVTSDTIVTGALSSGTTSSLIADAGPLTIAGGTSGGDVTLSTIGTATLGAITATGRKLTLTAADATINGVIAAQRIEVLNRAAGNALRLGNDLAAGTGFNLSEAEVNNLNAAEILLDAGTATGSTAQNIEIGKLALDTDSGSSKVDIFGTKRIEVTGAFTATGSATTRTIRFGGAATDTTRASVIRVKATASAGGGIDVDDAALELRGDKIGVGQDDGFLTQIGLTPNATPLGASDVATRFVGNANSSLYNAGIGGALYIAPGRALVTARSLTVRFTDYALFQNTSNAGRSTGVVLGGSAAAPVSPALRLLGPNPTEAGAFALFGSVNGTIEAGTSLLGPTVIELTAVSRANARVNGCVIGAAGGGCIANLVTQPVLGVFDASKADVFKTATDFELPFDPVVGTNNESLFGDVGTFGLGDIPVDAPPATTPSATTPPTRTTPCPPDDQTCNRVGKDTK